MGALVRTGESVHRAVIAWHEQADDSSRCELIRAARAMTLGASPARALASQRLGSDAVQVATLLELHGRAGGDLALMLGKVAQWMRTRDAMRRATQAGTAGMRLSGRMIAFLPLAAAPFVPYGNLLRGNRAATAVVLFGALLLAAGMRWMKRLLPLAEDSDDEAAVLCETAATIMQAGVGLGDALDHATRCRGPRLEGEVVSIRRRVALGATWGRAFLMSGDAGLRATGRVLSTAEAAGTTPAPFLAALADERRKHKLVDADERDKKAAVRMILPLTLLVLPGFLLLGFSPFLGDLPV